MYPFAYRHEKMKPYIDKAIFLDTPLDIALARRVLRDMGSAADDEIRQDVAMYLKYARVGYLQMLKDILPSSDDVIDGSMELEEIIKEAMRIVEEVRAAIGRPYDD